RAQALYQVTGDDKLLAPFRERLRSKDAKVRERGAVAFRYFQLKVAPPELVTALSDADAGVRSWAALALGEIADPKTVPALMAVSLSPGAQGPAPVPSGRRYPCEGGLSTSRVPHEPVVNPPPAPPGPGPGPGRRRRPGRRAPAVLSAHRRPVPGADLRVRR